MLQAATLPATLPATAVRDTLSAVFRQPAYDRSIARSLWSRIAETLARWIGEVVGYFQRSPALTRTVLVVASLLILALVARLAWVAWRQRTREASLEFGRDGAGRRAGGDPWPLAHRLAAAGDYTAAAHALYAALLEAIARRERVRLHPSRTVGDYVRDLRRRGSPLHPTFREFGRTYEVVVYGIGTCDRERWERLDALAREIVGAATGRAA